MLRIETEHENDGRWIGEVIGIPGVLAYGGTREEAIDAAKALAAAVLADRQAYGENNPTMNH